jgi:hypothetical protein
MVVRHRATHQPQLRARTRIKLTDSAPTRFFAHCCDRNCLAGCDREAFLKASEENLKKQLPELKQWLVTTLKAWRKPGAAHFTYKIDDKPVCRQAFRLYHGLSEHLLGRAHELLDSGGSVVSSSPHNHEHPQEAWVYAHLEAFFQRECDPVVSGKRVLSSFLTIPLLREQLRKEYAKDQQDGAAPLSSAPTQPLIRKVFKTRFHDVVLPKKGDWGICNTCSLFHSQLKSATSNLERDKLMKLQLVHQGHHLNARCWMAAEMLHTKLAPQDQHMIILDITRSTSLPHDRPNTSVTSL